MRTWGLHRAKGVLGTFGVSGRPLLQSSHTELLHLQKWRAHFSKMNCRSYSVGEQQRILEGLVAGSREFGFRATAKRRGVKGGGVLIARWFASKDDLKDKRQSHRKPVLTAHERALISRDSFSRPRPISKERSWRPRRINKIGLKNLVEKERRQKRTWRPRRINKIGAQEFG